MSTNGFIAEYTLSNPILQRTRERVPEVTFEVEDEQILPDGPTRLILWVRGTDEALDRFTTELRADSSITGFDVLSSPAERLLVGISLTSEAKRGLTYSDAIDCGLTLLTIESQGSGVDYLAQVPSRAALNEYRERCRERELSFTLNRLYRCEDEETEAYGVTPRQREALVRALELGYYEVPREVTTGDLAAEFEISTQAISALLRRGTERVLRNTVAEDAGT